MGEHGHGRGRDDGHDRARDDDRGGDYGRANDHVRADHDHDHDHADGNRVSVDRVSVDRESWCFQVN